MTERLPSAGPPHETADLVREQLNRFAEELADHMNNAHHGYFVPSCHTCMNISNGILGKREDLNRLAQESCQ